MPHDDPQAFYLRAEAEHQKRLRSIRRQEWAMYATVVVVALFAIFGPIIAVWWRG